MVELTLATLCAQVFTGLVLGMILVLLAIGLSLIFGLMTVVNFAHGPLYIVGAKTGFPLHPPSELAGAVNLGFTYFPLYRLFVIGVTIVVLLALFLFLEKTNVGLIIRAGLRDPLMVKA